MQDNLNKFALRAFVKDTLGCTCPDQVFRQITYEEKTNLMRCRGSVSRIEVGNRLLIYMLVTDSPEQVEHDLPFMIENGKRERDRYGFNRFRAVVSTRHVDAVVHMANDVFVRHRAEDDKVHLHVVSREDVKTIFAPAAGA